MSWRCEVCDSYNEESEALCFVCGQERSEESRREGLRLAREARRAALVARIDRILGRTGKILFALGAGGCLALVLISLAVKLFQGSFGDVFLSLSAVLQRWARNGLAPITDNLPVLMDSAGSGPVPGLLASGKAVALDARDAFADLLAASGHLLRRGAQNLSVGEDAALRPLWQRMREGGEALLTSGRIFMTAASHALARLWASLSSAVDVVTAHFR